MSGNEMRPTNSSNEEHQQHIDLDQVYQWILDLGDPRKRENALLELRYFVGIKFWG